MIRITKVKVEKNKKVNIEYQVLGKTGTWDDFAFTCSDEALPEFYQSIKALRLDVVKLCELPKGYISRIVVKGVSFSYSNEGVMGAVIIAAMQLKRSNCPLNLNTPHKPSQAQGDSEVPEETLLAPDCVVALKAVANECIKYIAGYRAQTDLFRELQPELIANQIIGLEIDKIFEKVKTE